MKKPVIFPGSGGSGGLGVGDGGRGRLLASKNYSCSAQSENRYSSGIVLRKVGILTLWFNSGIVPVQF